MAWIMGAAVLGGSLLGANASESAANTQADAANRAADLQQQQYQQTRTDTAPWRERGSNALSTIGQMQPQFTHSFDAGDLKSNLAPNYDFQLQQGLGAVKNFADSTGGLVSGNTLKGINDYAQGFAGNAYQQAFNNYNAQQTNIFNRLSTIAGLGSTTNQTVAGVGAQTAGNIASTLTSGAAAQAAGTVGAANAINNGIGNYMGWQYLKSPTSSVGGAAVPSSDTAPVAPNYGFTGVQLGG